MQQYKRQTYRLLDAQSGQSILDLGCGTGDDVRALGQIVGPEGRVVGVDNSQMMIDEAISRTKDLDLPIEFRLGEATQLDLDGDVFDGSRSDRVSQHLPDRTKALTELIRVTGSGGRIVISDPDWKTIAIDAPDADLTHRVILQIAAQVRHPRSGREWPRLFPEARLDDIEIHPLTMIFTHLQLVDQLLSLNQAVQQLQDANELAAEQAKAWMEALKDRDQQGIFFASMSGFLVAGRKP